MSEPRVAFRDWLAADRDHGAAELARRALGQLARQAQLLPADSAAALRRALATESADLAAVRPSMAPIANLLGRWRHGLDGLAHLPLAALREQAAAAADALAESSRRAGEEAAARAAAHIGPGRTLVTLSLSSTVLALFGQLRARGVRAILSESRPLNEGYRLADRLSAWGIPVTLVTDAALGLAAADAHVAVVGADALLADGSVVNKTGTLLLALAAREAGIPFYVCCESFKRLPPEAPPPLLEAMDPAELGAPALPGVTVVNRYFEVTPARLVSGWITEAGVEAGPRGDG